MSEKLYALLLKLYPEDFRETYGDDAMQLFRDRAQDEKGFVSGLRLWLDLLRDLAISIPREHRRASTFQLLAERSLNPARLLVSGVLSAWLLWGCVTSVAHSQAFPVWFPASQSLQGRIQAELLLAQKAPGEKHLAFEVVSIRRHTAASGLVRRPTTTMTGFSSIGLPLFAIFQMAYVPPSESVYLRGDEIEGAPGWLSEETYDVTAKVDDADLADWQKPEMTQTMLHSMLQTMLAERCKVVVHHQSKEMPVYNLVVAKGGPKFKQSAETRKLDGGGMIGTSVRVAPTPNGIQYFGISMAILTQTLLPHMAGRPVIDKTGLSGSYDLTLPDLKPMQAEADESIFTVLPEALGLRLEPAKGQVDMLVIDHVERPSEN